MEGAKKENLIPNSTQIPNAITDFVLPRIPDPEARCLIYICRRTFGFKKKMDRIGLEQFVRGIRTKDGKILDHGAGIGRSTAREALANLAEAGFVIVAANKIGKPNGYEINLEVDIEAAVKKLAELKDSQNKRKGKKAPQQNLFTLSRTQQGAAHAAGYPVASSQQGSMPRTQHHKTKGNQEKHSISRTAEPPAPEKEVLSQNDPHKRHKRHAHKEAERKPRPPSPHRQFTDWWHEIVPKTRNIKPVYTGADMRNLKRILDLGVLTQTQLQQLALYFLGSYAFRTFSPSISTFLSAGIINGLMNRMENHPDFWKELDELTILHLPRITFTNPEKNASEMVEALAKMKAQLFKEPFTPRARTEIQMQVAREERVARR